MQWKRLEEAKAERDHANSRGADPDAVGYLHQASERNRLQLEHYLVVANISDEMVAAIVRPHNKLKVENYETTETTERSQALWPLLR